MKVKENVTVYSCEYCKKKMFLKSAMERHEQRCYGNPENNRPCLNGCKHFEKRKFEVLTDRYQYHCNDYFAETSLFYCNHHNHCLISPQTELKGNAILQENISSEPPNVIMPKSCEFYSQETYF